MRITVHVPDEIAREMKIIAANEKRSVSSVVSQSIEYFVKEKKRRQLGNKILELAGKTALRSDAVEQLHWGREDVDRP